MKLAILGGSFNPVHLGHLFLADAVLAELKYDRVVMVPAYRSPFKIAVPGMESSTDDRLEMTAASIAGDPRLTVDDCELRREGVSYTVDTVADIIRRYAPEGKPGLIIGDDLAAEFPRWKNSAEIFDMADVIIARRISSGDLNLPYTCTCVANDIINISSAMIRRKIEEGGAWHFLVPAAVRTIIEERGLYGACRQRRPSAAKTEIPAKSLIVKIEEAARESLGLERFLHSRNTALFAYDLCRKFNVEYPTLLPDLGYLAGIAHDLGKRLSDKEHLKIARQDGRELSRLEKEKPQLLHGWSSAAILRERFRVYNDDVMEAVALHTSGGENMGPLAKIVYIADKLEVSREKIDPAFRTQVYNGTCLDAIFSAVLDQTVSFLRNKKLQLSGETLRLLKKMEEARA
jgi:nicotinate-nucleotide adenylyltransferase